MNENNKPQELPSDNKVNMPLSEENLDLIFSTLKYCINNPIILGGVSICGLVMTACIMLNNKNN